MRIFSINNFLLLRKLVYAPTYQHKAILTIITGDYLLIWKELRKQLGKTCVEKSAVMTQHTYSLQVDKKRILAAKGTRTCDQYRVLEATRFTPVT